MDCLPVNDDTTRYSSNESGTVRTAACQIYFRGLSFTKLTP